MIHAAAILLALGAGLIGGRLQSSTASVPPRLPWTTLATAVIVAMMVAAQLAFPPLLPLLGRDPAMLQSGQLWRALTALFVQDYGLTGAFINLSTLLILGPVAEKRLGTAQWLIVYLGGGVITEFLALAWQPHGAGNSIACFALAGALALRALKRTMGSVQLCVCIVSLSAAVILLLLRDIHGLGYWAGVTCALVWRRLHDLPPRPRSAGAREMIRRCAASKSSMRRS